MIKFRKIINEWTYSSEAHDEIEKAQLDIYRAVKKLKALNLSELNIIIDALNETSSDLTNITDKLIAKFKK
jgi:uncharacterized protein YfkK (UPF0435 family)